MACIVPLTLFSWKTDDDACILSIDLHKASSNSDGDSGDAGTCGQARVKFKDGDNVVLWSAVLDWAVNAKVQHCARLRLLRGLVDAGCGALIP